MTNWTVTEISEIANSYAGGTPNRSKPEYFNGNIPWISSGEVNQASINNTIETITEAGLAYSSAKWVPKDSILVAMYGATAGQVSYLNIKATTNQAVLALLPIEGKADATFLYYLVNFNRDKILYFAQGSGQPNLNKKIIDTTKVAVPEYPIQQKIAKILSTIDGQIEKTETIIAKYQAVKQGMLQDLFTRGIDVSTGELRPKYEDAPELYKDSPLGMIPKEWDAKPIGALGKLKNGLNKDKSAFGSGSLFVSISDAFDEILQCTTLNRVQLTDSELKQYTLEKDDIIFVRSSVKLDGVGYNTIFKSHHENVAYSGFMIRFRLENKRTVNTDYLNLQFRSENFRRQLFSYATVSANVNINQPSLSSLFAILPSKDEQDDACNRLFAINTLIETNKKELNKHLMLKQGLMSDLLSGKVEVRIN